METLFLLFKWLGLVVYETLVYAFTYTMLIAFGVGFLLRYLYLRLK